MRIFICNRQKIWEDELIDGFTALGHDVQKGYPETTQAFTEIIERFNPQLIMTLGGPTIYDEYILEYLGETQKNRNYTYVHWDTEGVRHYGFTDKFIQKTRPDILFTVCPIVKEMMSQRGYLTYILPYGVNPKVHYPLNEPTIYDNIYSLIASNYKHRPDDYRCKSYQTLLDPLLEKHIPIQVRGYGWKADTERIAKGLQVFPFCNYSEINKVYNGAYINLVIQNTTEGITRRTYEILGAGGFILSYDSLELRKHFKSGKELLISSSPEETLEIVDYYNTHPEEYWAIRKNAAKRAHEFTYEKRLKQVFEEIRLDGKILLPT
ncbi:MAG: hypothetical protein E7231_05385 [Cellulosilyticum sp.]|nr:hypothetical protein [Cellulosilyticum sp.]